VDGAMRARMGEAAVRVAGAAGYYNAGTVEFLVDQNKNFYFLEMNARLQVEHPVTEMVTGLDLVKLQIRVAAGEKLTDILPGGQESIQLRGAAIECRVYAEDPDNFFFPCPGTIRDLETPSGPGVRDDSGIYAGWTVPTEYDPLLSKLVTWAGTREGAIARMLRALGEYHIEGIKTNLRLFEQILRFPDFLRGDLDTGLIERLQKAPTNAHAAEENHVRAAMIAASLAHEQRLNEEVFSEGSGPAVSRWKSAARSQGLRGSGYER
jgi:acetyl-CoA carboxylase, biotin carboxylase subunit